MKKFLILAAAVAAMAACTKSEVVYDDNDTEIGLAPVNYKATKLWGPIDGSDYPVNENFAVFAKHTTSPSGTSSKTDEGITKWYLKDVEFTHMEDKIWHGNPSYYWPKTGSLYFMGYSPAEINDGASVDCVIETNYDSYLVINGFEQNDYSYTNGAVQTPTNSGYPNQMWDLMWFDPSARSYTSTDGVPSITFHHALSRMRFVMTCDQGLEDLFRVTKVVLKGVRMKGNLTAYDNSKAVPSWTFDDNNTEDLTLYDVNVNGNSTWLQNNAGFNIEDVLLIPQTTAVIEIYYDQKPYKNAPDEFTSTHLYTATLSGGSDQDNIYNQWVYSRYYTYQFQFNAAEIKLTPTIVDWAELTFVNGQIQKN